MKKGDQHGWHESMNTVNGNRPSGFALTAFLLFALTLTIPAQADTTIQVTVTAVGGHSIPKAYVGVAKETDRWSHPSFEELTNKNGGVTFQIAPGIYYAVAAAPGFLPVVRRLTIAANKKQEVRLELTPLTNVDGVLIDSDGTPIANGRCSKFEQLIPDRLSTRSDLSRRTLAVDEVTSVDERGVFRTTVSATGSTALYCDGPGLAPVLRMVRAGEPLTIALQPGGQLTLETDRVEPELIVELSAVTETTVSPEWQSRVWARAVDRSSIVFDSIGPGTYKIVGRDSDPLRFPARQELGTVTVESGSHSAIKLNLPEANPRASEYTTIHIHSQRLQNSENLQGFGASPGQEPIRVAHSIERTAGGMAIYLATRKEDLSYLTSSESIVTRTYDERLEPMEGRVYRKAEATIQFRTENEMPLPSAGILELGNCQRKERVLLPIEVDASGLSRLEIPAECRSLIFRFDGYGAVVLAVSWVPGKSAALGEHILRATANLEVRVTREPGVVTVPNAAVTVSSSRNKDHPGPSISIATGEANEAGVALLRDLPAGVPLVVEARPPDRRLSTFTEVELVPGEHRMIEISLPVPATLEIEPKLSADLLRRAKSAVITAISIARRDKGQSLDRRYESLKDRKLFVFEDLHPGRWEIVAIVEIDGHPHPIELEGIDLAPSENRRLSLKIDPPLFAGRVTLRNQGIDANVGFMSSVSPRNGSRIGRSVRSTPDGAFTVLLPVTGPYIVEVTLGTKSPGVMIPIGELNLSDPSQLLSIVVPEGRVTVNVRNQSGPVAGITVIGLPSREDLKRVRGGNIRMMTGPDGRARFTTLSRGEWTFQVQDESGKVVTKKLQVEEGVAAEVDLTL